MTESAPTKPGGSAEMQGSKVEPVYTRRRMKMFLLNEGEIRTVSALNMQATIFFTIASFFASLGLGIYINAVFYDKLSPAGQVAWSVAAPALLVVAAAFLFLGIVMIVSRSKLWNSIEQDSQIDALDGLAATPKP